MIKRFLAWVQEQIEAIEEYDEASSVVGGLIVLAVLVVVVVFIK